MSVNLVPASASFSSLSKTWENAQKQYVESTAMSRSALIQVLQGIDADSCPTSYNFHAHTTKSDGQLDPIALIQQAIAIGLKGLAITDHHTTEGYQIARHWLNHRKSHACKPDNIPSLTLWTGVEINAHLLETDVHILGYAFDPDAPSIYPYLQHHSAPRQNSGIWAVIAAIQNAGGLAVLAHPARYRRPSAELIPEASRLGIDGVEVFYGYRRTNPWYPTPKITEEIQQLAWDYNLLPTCGTDTHGLNLLVRL
ncbi:PHP domain-containing protein [Arthrospira platensis BEA 1257B]